MLGVRPTPAPAPARGGVQGAARGADQSAPPARVEAPPAVTLGLRAESLRLSLRVLPTVVIVPDGPSYLAAIESWRPSGRFPVLIDDGTRESRHHIALFVAAFKPERVVSWAAQAPGRVDALALRGPELESRLMRAVARAWGAADTAEPLEGLKAVWGSAYTPTGLVVTFPNDTAWTAALAIAAGRGQPLAVVPAPASSRAAAMPLTEALTLDAAVRCAAERTGYTFAGLGDQLDALTLAATAPARVTVQAEDPLQPQMGAPFDPRPGEPLALTDLLGRDLPARAQSRWAWAGQVSGSAARGAYTAMCGLFLTPADAWLFEGYAQGFGNGVYSMAQSHAVLQSAKFPVSGAWVPTDATTATWARTAFDGVHAGLLLVNSSGQATTFDLRPRLGNASDMPVLRRPAAAYVIHSFSAANPHDGSTLAGRLLRRGAYAYVGSVHEPLLAGFVPSHVLVQRMLVGMPLAAAARFDGPRAAPWRVHVQADPLVVMPPPGATAGRAQGPVPLSGAVQLDQSMRDALRQGRIAEGVRLLGLIGRDADAVRYAQALLDQPPPPTPPTPPPAPPAPAPAPAPAGPIPADVAAELLGPAMRQGAWPVLLACVEAHSAQRTAAEFPDALDALWHLAWVHRATLTDAQAHALARSYRPGQALRDAEDLASWLRAAGKAPLARAALLNAQPAISSEADRRRLAALLDPSQP
ncbi:MAG: hypothetical protein C0475_06255 [Planctomyces sp.]|nr:hypothetical protein [Planctomyces sp.]